MTVVDETIERTLRERIQPLLRVHGGGIELESCDDGVVRLRFTDACTACRLRPLTYVAAIRPRLLALPGVRDVQIRGVRVSDHVLRRMAAVHGDAASLSQTPTQEGTRAHH